MIFVLAPLCHTPLGGYVPEIFRGLHHQLPQLDKAAVKVKKEANKVLGVLQKLPKELNVLWRSCQGTGLFVPGPPCMRVRLRRLESIYTICVEYVQRRAARFVCNDYFCCSSVDTMLSNLAW